LDIVSNHVRNAATLTGGVSTGQGARFQLSEDETAGRHQEAHVRRSRNGRELDSNALREIAASLGPDYRTVGDRAYAILHRAIVTGLLEPGEKLGQEDLAVWLGISREPVRSAILQLASDGLVVVHPHRGAVVRTLSVERIREIYALRVLLETHALRLGLEAMTPERLAELERIAARLDRAERSPASVKMRTEFYELLYDRDRNPVLVELVDRLRSDVGRYWARRREASAHEHGHRPLLHYARTRNVDAAAAWLQAHFSEVADELVAALDESAA
jgi:DNA-binding GntR family transcriptional regulator